MVVVGGFASVVNAVPDFRELDHDESTHDECGKISLSDVYRNRCCANNPMVPTRTILSLA